MSGLVGDAFSHERRIINIDDAILRLKTMCRGGHGPNACTHAALQHDRAPFWQ